MTTAYPHLTIEDFGRTLLDSGDLDPVYIALSRMDWDLGQGSRWLVAYWCTYHAGFASWASEHTGPWYWKVMRRAAENEEPTPIGGRWPRAPERRHWRGAAAVNCVRMLESRYPLGPEAMVVFVSCIADARPTKTIPYAAVKARVEEHPLFGPWIAFKAADMLERVCDVPIHFGRGDIIYDSPAKAAVALWLQRAGLPPEARVKDPQGAINQVFDYLAGVFGAVDAPPGGGRKVDIQEIETILCKYGSHLSGHYPLYNDLTEIRAGAAPWAEVSATAREFLHHFPTVPLSSQASAGALAAGVG